MRDSFSNPNVNFKNSPGAGKWHGVGVPAQVALKKGGFTDNPRITSRASKSIPPRKMN